MPAVTADQFKAIAERGITVLVAFAVGRGWFPAGQAADLVALLVAAAAIGYGFYINRPAAIMDSAAAINPNQTKIVTTPELAAATSATNVVSSAEKKVVDK